MSRGLFGSSWLASLDAPLMLVTDIFPTAREAIASAEASVEQGGGGAFAFSQKEGGPFVLLRKFGQLWPETDDFHPGDVIGPGEMFYNGERVRFRSFEQPTRRERRSGQRLTPPTMG
jgi:hypothetical protein